MRPFVPLLAMLLVAAFFAGRWTGADEEAAEPEATTVRALRYRIVWADSALDLSHGGGRWVHELFFPDTKVTASLVHESQVGEGETLRFETRPRIYVGRAEAPRTDLKGFTDAPAQPPQEVEVPADLARELARFADLTDRYRKEGARLGAACAERLALEPIVESPHGADVPTPPAGD